MKTKLALLLLASLPLTGCLSTMIDLASSQNYKTKWSGQCLSLTQDVELWKGSKNHSFSRNFIMAKSSKRISSHLKKQDTLAKGTNFEVAKVYDVYIHGSAGNWHLRVNLEVLDGPYRGLIVETPGVYSMHPYPFFFTHSTQETPFTARENLQPSTIEFNPKFLKRCS